MEVVETNSELPLCFVAIPHGKEFSDFIKKNFRTYLFDGKQNDYVAQLTQSDFAIIDLTAAEYQNYHILGLAQAMGKPVIPVFLNGKDIPEIAHSFSVKPIPFGRGVSNTTFYKQLSNSLSELKQNPKKANIGFSNKLSQPFFVDWEKLQESDAENLCRELLSQMGFRRIDWMKESKEVDIIAEFPRKDPDGFEYKELWMVHLSKNSHSIWMTALEIDDAKYVLRRMLGVEDFKSFLKGETPQITLLLIDIHREKSAHYKHLLSRQRKRNEIQTIRLRLWDRDYMTSLVHQFPNIGYKYFSDEARALKKFRKGPEELYQENLKLGKELADTTVMLEDEKKQRVRAERDAVWKDISFSAAHKIGNPIFAIETSLAPLQKRIEEDRKKEAIEVIANVKSSVEKAKNIVEQFKSLTKAQQINPIPILLKPLLLDSCKILQDNNVNCVVSCPDDIRINADPERLGEVFDELANNALHWLDKREKKVEIIVTKAEFIPFSVDSALKYIAIHFQDNGSGVSFKNKDLIFDTFFSTYDQGTGIGLALVRRIIEGHQGMIRETGIPQKGANFEIYLPVLDSLEDSEIKVTK